MQSFAHGHGDYFAFPACRIHIALYALLTASYSFADKPTQATTPARRNITSSRRLPSFFTVLLSVICIVLAFAFPVNYAESIKADAAETSIIQDNMHQVTLNRSSSLTLFAMKLT
ncbi:hypothetical protein [Bifidobacterium moukalabense]|uniref:hypothetical protein n=1 Tax=Bifidobacterium moukalabense TaxID=1333651 RepID=UPI0010F9D341|nr:hypothetical protein [Bifidobacterium moukalabense]